MAAGGGVGEGGLRRRRAEALGPGREERGGLGSTMAEPEGSGVFPQELEAIPMFMKRCPAEIDAARQPDLACLQSLLFDEEQEPAELAKMYKNEGNEYFREKDYGRAVVSYSEGLKKKCEDAELNAVLHTNRGAAHFHLGNYRSALNDAIQAKKLKPTHLKAIIRGALCHMELKNFSEAIAWCEEGLRIDSKEKKLVEMRAKADKLKRAAERDARKAKVIEKKEQGQKETLLAAIKERNIKLVLEPSNEEEDISDGLAEISLDGFHSHNATGAKVHLDADGNLNWPVLFLYPEHEQTDFIEAFHENSRFIDHLTVMFAELPPWDLERKYLPGNLELYFEDEERAEMYELNPDQTLLQALQHQRYFVKAGTPTVLAFVKRSPFSKKYFTGRKVHRLRR
uniref:Tetratricopeptide repeat domain 4 n=1 Tax=Anas platyrhynchos platyrhynchos TaxID=8840 RepID=A0A493T1Z0_ANAPP